MIVRQTDRTFRVLADAALAACLALFALLVRVVNGALTIDDAYITFRYAINLRLGHGLVYTPGEVVLGTTTPLYAALLALLPVESSELPTAALWLNAALDAGNVAVLFWIARRLSGASWPGALAALAYALMPMSIAFSAGGMETSLFVLLGLVSFSLNLGGHRRLAMLSAALATLTRPEGMLVAALLLLDEFYRTRRLPLVHFAVYLAVLAPWASYAAFIYGTPIPSSVAAKAASYQVRPWLNLAALLIGAGTPGFSVLQLAEGESQAGITLAVAAVGLVGLYLLARAGARAALARDPRALPLILFAPLYALAYALAGIRGVRMFHWYLVPLLPSYVLGMSLGASALAGVSARRRHAAIVASFALAVAWQVSGLGLSRGWLDRPAFPVGLSLTREQAYYRAGEDLRQRLRPGDVIAAPEIGALGFASGAPILDTFGLVSPRSVSYYPLPPHLVIGDNAVPPRLIEAERPRFVVALDQFTRLSLEGDQWFRQHYRLEARYPATVWFSEAVLVYERMNAG